MMRLLVAVGAVFLRPPLDCAARISAAEVAAQAEPQVERAPSDAPLREDRQEARVFWGLRNAGCDGKFAEWQRGRLPADCREEYDTFRHGLPPPTVSLSRWRDVPPPNSSAVAYLVSVADPSALSLVVRTFRHLHRPGDQFLYLVDTAAAPGYAEELSAALEKAVPNSGARVEAAEQHSVMYYWPRVESVLGGLRSLVAQGSWSYAVHLSEHDYPLHGAQRVRELASSPTRPLVLDAVPKVDATGAADSWYWWKEDAAVFVCGAVAVPDPTVRFPEASFAEQVHLHRGSEWFALPREVVEYVVADKAAAPGVASFIGTVKHRWSVDEVFWPTLLKSIPGLDRPTSPGWYVEWDTQHGHSPDTFEGDALEKHRADLLSSDRLFARKVTLPGSSSLLDALDAREEPVRQN